MAFDMTALEFQTIVIDLLEGGTGAVHLWVCFCTGLGVSSGLAVWKMVTRITKDIDE